MFTTGQKVVCIDDKFDEAVKQFYVALPTEGVVYVVRGTSPGVAQDGQTAEIATYLVGLRNPLSSVAPFRERGFRCERFKPLDSTTTADSMNRVQGDERRESVADCIAQEAA